MPNITPLSESGSGYEILIGYLQNAVFWGDRAEAARDLRKYPIPGVIQALLGAVADEDYLVRYDACESLRAIYSLPGEIPQYEAIFDKIREDKQKMKYTLAQAQIKELIQNRGKLA
jgi:HEAT repeat protein